MELRLLGHLEVEADGQDVTPPRRRERAVLGLLLLRHGRVVSVEELIDAVWGQQPPMTARTALHGVVAAIRRRLGAERIETRPPGYRLRLLAGDGYDVARFEALVADAAGERPAIRSALLAEALALFRGEPMADVDLAIDVSAEAARLEELRLAAEEGLIAAELELGRHLEVIPRLERLAADHPFREGLRSQLMLALFRAGRQADALRVAQDVRRVLAFELGVQPGPALQRLERQILEQDPELLGDDATPAGLAAKAVSDVLPAGFVNILAAVPMAEGMAVGDASRVRDLVARVASEHAGVEVPSAPRSRSGLVMGFGRARDAAASATAIQRAARREGLALALGIHSIPPGNPSPGPAATSRHPDVERAIWLAAVGHAGQVVLSRESRDLLREAPLHEVDVRDLGEHRLADLAPAQPLFQLVARGLDVDFPPTRGLEARPTNLPVQATRFIDREAELDAIVALLQDPAIRLLTLTGPGGTGKTRLALHAAAELLDEVVDGAWFVPLDGLSNPDLLGPAIATVLGVGEDGAATAQTAPVRELRDKRVLLVLDNFEHLLGASAVVADLLAGTSGLKVLVTSRAPLRLESERAFAVPPLPSPPADARLEVQEMLRIGAVALFDARARTARPSFSLTADNAQVVAQLCRALDGLPLAIELAASRVALMPPEAVLDRLDRPLRLLTSRMRPGPKRHRALEAAIDWTHELLEPAVQRLFAGLAAFAGGWTLDAAEAVCDDGLDVIDGLAGLVDHSLVRVDTAGAAPRFGMLETIREYAVTRLDASGQGLQIERRHAAFYLALAESAEPHLRGNPGEWVARLETEHNNLRAALDRLAATGNAATQARLAGALWRFWYLAGHLREGRARLEHAVAVHPEPTAARAKVLIGAAVMAVNTGDAAVARERAADALALTRSLGDAWSAAYAQFMLANAASSEGDDDTARSAYEASLRAFRTLGDEHSALLVSRNLAGTLEDLGDRDAARTLYQDNLRRARADRNGRLEASTLGALATIAFDEGRVIDANLMLRESLRLHRELGDRLDTAVDLARAARTLAMAGRAEEAARLHGAVQAIRDQLGIRGQTVGAMGSDTLAALRRQLDDTALTRLVGEGDRLPLDGAVGLALDALA